MPSSHSECSERRFRHIHAHTVVPIFSVFPNMWICLLPRREIKWEFTVLLHIPRRKHLTHGQGASQCYSHMVVIQLREQMQGSFPKIQWKKRKREFFLDIRPLWIYPGCKYVLVSLEVFNSFQMPDSTILATLSMKHHHKIHRLFSHLQHRYATL